MSEGIDEVIQVIERDYLSRPHITLVPDGIDVIRSTHGMAGTPEYSSWICMRERCNNPKSPKYHRYGGRGIRVCFRWSHCFQAFFDDVGLRPSARHTLDRIDNNGGYTPKNCRWATPEEQGNNKSNNRRITIDGEIKTITEWSRLSGNCRATISERLKAGWEPRKAVFHKRRATE